MRIQLWSYNYAPEPTGIGPVSATWAEAMAARGHAVSVVAAHPHYPEPAWPRPPRPVRRRENGIDVVRLPLLVGRQSAAARMRQDASFSASLLSALPFLPRADLRVVVSPCFPALSVALIAGALGRVPWLLWLQDILPDGAVSTGLVDEDSAVIRASRKLEMAAYARAGRIVVISDRFEQNLRSKGVPAAKLTRIYNPATQPLAAAARTQFDAPRVLVMGNIGHSQGLADLVRRFEADTALEQIGAELLITGTGVAADEVAAAATTERVKLLGVVGDAELKELLASSSVGLVAQAAELPEFNFPSKLMNYLAAALPVAGFVAEDSEVAGVIRKSGAGIVLPNAAPETFGGRLAALLGDQQALARASAAAFEFARSELTPDALASRFEQEMARIDRRD